ncbi:MULTISPECIES: PTS sugar transporter subunit IIA [unclassified Luteimonas]|uniref:PTS sugar transporter subunit IIA n=1 Tax=unclassified Luteimonas TaxID=2629088 RepID=UPI0018F06242|nr:MULTISPECIES: PTS sugar transporter subunit IIA [unclassified Luteimonas]MBJ6982501.1 PTS sugar transporter subunit IIA [Luteimonas sp. MC1572]MBJ7574921.1 PTS sugar transporter subunit IIA [Luteimonas sp. MC1828]QQO03757.1 PTS sugar transporter subunit IIA [Luteimonas sp. MC1572]
MPYTDLLAAERIVLLAAPGSRDQVLDAAARLLCDADPGSRAALAAGLREREAVGSTAIGHGVAIPHCRSGAHAASAAFLKLSPAVDFGALDGAPVDLVFAMGVPVGSAQQHLDTLSELAARFADAEFRDALRAAPDLPALRSVLLRDAAAPGSGSA